MKRTPITFKEIIKGLDARRLSKDSEQRYNALSVSAKLALEDFRNDICTNDTISKSSDLEEINWYDMSIGYFLAKGLSFTEVFDAALLARYHFGYWTEK